MTTRTKFEIEIILYRAYPMCRPYIADKVYTLPSRAQVWDELISSYIEDYKYQAEICDCDDYALFCHAWIRQRQYKEKWTHPLAFGEAWSAKHACNITILDDETVWIAEPQNDALRPASDFPGITFVRM